MWGLLLLVIGIFEEDRSIGMCTTFVSFRVRNFKAAAAAAAAAAASAAAALAAAAVQSRSGCYAGMHKKCTVVAVIRIARGCVYSMQCVCVRESICPQWLCMQQGTTNL